MSDAMQEALAEARAAALRGEVPVGAVITDPNGTTIVATGNRTIELCDPTAHAEILAIRAAGAILGNQRLNDCILTVTLEPCTMCAAAISFARIKRVVYAAEDPKMGAVDNGPRFFQQATCNHRPEVISGVREKEAASLLLAFFNDKR